MDAQADSPRPHRKKTAKLQNGEISPQAGVKDAESLDIVEKRLLGTSAWIVLTVLGLTLVYWFLSGGLTFFNKWFFSIRGFRFPVLVVMGTFVVHFVIMMSIRLLATKYEDTGVLPKPQVIPRRLYAKFLIPIGLCTGLEIASSNLALLKLSVSFHTMVHASKPIFIAGWSVVIGLEKPSVHLFLIVSMVTIGVMMLTIGESGIQKHEVVSSNSTLINTIEDQLGRLEASEHPRRSFTPRTDPGFDPEGFALILFSCFCSGARWSLVQLMLQRVDLRAGAVISQSIEAAPDTTTSKHQPTERLTPMNLVFYLAPISALSLLPFFLLVELMRFQEYVSTEPDATGDIFGFEMVVSFWALFLNLAEFYFVRTTSGIVLSFASISKELLLVLISVLVNGDEMPPLNIVGFIFCVIGIIAYHKTHHPHHTGGDEQSSTTKRRYEQLEMDLEAQQPDGEQSSTTKRRYEQLERDLEVQQHNSIETITTAKEGKEIEDENK